MTMEKFSDYLLIRLALKGIHYSIPSRALEILIGRHGEEHTSKLLAQVIDSEVYPPYSYKLVDEVVSYLISNDIPPPELVNDPDDKEAPLINIRKGPSPEQMVEVSKIISRHLINSPNIRADLTRQLIVSFEKDGNYVASFRIDEKVYERSVKMKAA